MSKQKEKRVKMGSGMDIDSVLVSDEDQGSSNGSSDLDIYDNGHKSVAKFEEEIRQRTESSREVESARGPLKKSKYSDFYYKLEALNEKIKVYKDVFYSRENHFINNKKGTYQIKK